MDKVDRIQQQIQDNRGSGGFRRFTNDVMTGVKVGSGATGAGVLDAMVRGAIAKANGGKVPEVLDTTIGEQLSPILSAGLVQLTLDSPFGEHIPKSVTKRVDPMLDYMVVGATAAATKDTLSPLFAAIAAGLMQMEIEDDGDDDGDDAPEAEAKDKK
jgi:hypothetical protein